MDYGKMAYMRLEEIEKRLSPKADARVKNAAYAVYPDFPLRAGNDFTALTAEGSGSLTAAVNISVLCESRGTISLYAGGKRAESFPVTQPGAAERFRLFPLVLSGPAELQLKAENGFTGHITSVHMALFGENAAVTGKRGVFAADERANVSAVIFSKNEQIFLRTARKNPDGTESVLTDTVGYGSAGDVCVSEEGDVVAAFCDHASNLFLVKVSPRTGGVMRRRIFGSKVQSVAVSAAADGITVVLVQDKKPFILRAGTDLTLTAGEFRADSLGACDSAAFVKGTAYPALVCAADGKLFLKERIEERATAEVFSVRITAALETL